MLEENSALERCSSHIYKKTILTATPWQYSSQNGEHGFHEYSISVSHPGEISSNLNTKEQIEILKRFQKW